MDIIAVLLLLLCCISKDKTLSVEFILYPRSDLLSLGVFNKFVVAGSRNTGALFSTAVHGSNYSGSGFKERAHALISIH